MRKSIAAALLPLLCLHAPGRAYDEQDWIKTGYVGYDFLFVRNAFENNASELFLVGSGVTASQEVKAGFGGVRLGVFMGPEEGRTSVGASIGYLHGPSSEAVLSDSAGPFARVTHDVSFARILTEAQVRVNPSHGLDLRFKAGVGYAAGWMRGVYDFTAGGRFKNTDTWSGLTWEAGPSILFGGKDSSLEIGAVAAGFPKKQAVISSPTMLFPRFSWTTWGVNVAFHFKGKTREENVYML